MNEIRNLIAVCVALVLVGGVAWIATQIDFSEEVEVVAAPPPPPPEPPKLPDYRVSWPFLEKWVQETPTVVLSKSLPKSLVQDMDTQCNLLVVVTGLTKSVDRNARFIEELEKLRQAFPDPEVATNHSWDRGYANYFVINRSSNPQMVGDFRHTVINANLSDVDYVIENLTFKTDSWRSKLSKYHGPNTTSAQYRSDMMFLDNMPDYINAWRKLKENWQVYDAENPDVALARKKWADFEKTKLPILNNYIEGSAENSWVLNGEGVFSAKLPRRSTLYLMVTIADRKFYLPLDPSGDPRLGLTFAEISS